MRSSILFSFFFSNDSDNLELVIVELENCDSFRFENVRGVSERFVDEDGDDGGKRNERKTKSKKIKCHGLHATLLTGIAALLLCRKE